MNSRLLGWFLGAAGTNAIVAIMIYFATKSLMLAGAMAIAGGGIYAFIAVAADDILRAINAGNAKK